MGRRPGSRNLKRANQWAEREQAKIQRAYRFRPESLAALADLDLDPELWQQQWRRTGDQWQIAAWKCLSCQGMFVRPGCIETHPEKCPGPRTREEPEEWQLMRLRDGRIVKRNIDNED